MLSREQKAKTGTPTLSWSNLPVEMQELVLGSLSLKQLGRVATTCRSVHVFLRRQLAEHKARCDLDVLKWFGHKRVTGVADIVNDFIKAEGMVMNLTIGQVYFCWLSADGLLRVEVPAKPSSPTISSRQATLIVANSCDHSPSPSTLYLRLLTPSRADVTLLVDRPPKRVLMSVARKKHALYSEGEALVQALLSWGFGPQHDAWLHVDVTIEGLGPQDVELEAGRAPAASGGPAPKLEG